MVPATIISTRVHYLLGRSPDMPRESRDSFIPIRWSAIVADSVEFRPAPSIDVVPVEFRGGVTAPAWSESTVRVRERERDKEKVSCQLWCEPGRRSDKKTKFGVCDQRGRGCCSRRGLTQSGKVRA
ncbi:uncharacterized protein LOC119765077 [Culex quinquefasciatus]|uniref:uncharacterized protein LOC119765077 n=1 Tax=Culex quinquefasciatus TaxID=7176 RepID=UPI0018E33B51|nr:uncharacterized protein LOC119765077 [Culex quinquefasciatus]